MMPYKDRQRKLSYWSDYYKLNTEKCKENRRRSWLRLKFGISIEDYNKLLIKQNFSCALCNKHMSEFKNSLAVDHCHETGEVRGLLCFQCNTCIVKLGDNVKAFERILNYLKGN